MSNKLCFIAPSGYGKSTAIGIISEKYELINIKIAEPLYELQNYFYNYIGVKMRGEQDGELLQYLGMKIRKESENFLLNCFTDKFNKASNFTLITNDDCRPPDYQYLKGLGFIFIGINGYNRDRLDHRPSDPKLSIEWQDKANCDYWLDNWGSMDEYRHNIDTLLMQIMKDKRG